jgi:hypothetical protein
MPSKTKIRLGLALSAFISRVQRLGRRSKFEQRAEDPGELRQVSENINERKADKRGEAIVKKKPVNPLRPETFFVSGRPGGVLR